MVKLLHLLQIIVQILVQLGFHATFLLKFSFVTVQDGSCSGQ